MHAIKIQQSLLSGNTIILCKLHHIWHHELGLNLMSKYDCSYYLAKLSVNIFYNVYTPIRCNSSYVAWIPQIGLQPNS